MWLPGGKAMKTLIVISITLAALLAPAKAEDLADVRAACQYSFSLMSEYLSEPGFPTSLPFAKVEHVEDNNKRIVVFSNPVMRLKGKNVDGIYEVDLHVWCSYDPDTKSHDIQTYF
jgi:hypothetical protein